MTRSIFAGLCILSGWLTATAALSHTRNPFMAIVQRNVFALRPPDPVKVTTPQPVLPKVILNGISTMMGTKEALLEILAPPQRFKPSKPDWCILKEGEKKGSLQVLRIDEKTRKVTVNNSGTVATLGFEKPAPAAAQPRPARPPIRRFPFPMFRLARH